MSGLEQRYSEVIFGVAYSARLDNFAGAARDLEVGLSGCVSAFASAGLALLKPHLEAVHRTGKPLFPLPRARCDRGEDFLRMFSNTYTKVLG
jgi:hypothetical protein